MATVLVTGAAGFVGSAVCQTLRHHGHTVYRHLRKHPSPPADVVLTAELTAQTDWSLALQGVDVVIHTAARVHMMQDTAKDPLAEFMLVNRDATLQLAAQAANAGVKRFIYLSSIKAMGEGHMAGVPFRADQPARPMDAYGRSKLAAEQGLTELAARTGMEVIVIRPPLVYGPGVKANFYKLMMLMQKQLPLPFGAVRNKRSLVALDNLVDLIRVCISHPAAANKILLVSDDHDLSTPELMQLLAKAGGKKAVLVPVPTQILYGVAKFAGKEPAIERLCGDLMLDIAPTKTLLQWQPPVTAAQAIEQAVAAALKVV